MNPHSSCLCGGVADAYYPTQLIFILNSSEDLRRKYKVLGFRDRGWKERKFPLRSHYSELYSSLEMKEGIANKKKKGHKSLSQVVFEHIIIASVFQVLRLQIFTNKPGFSK